MPQEPRITDPLRKMRTLESNLAKEKQTSKALRTERAQIKRQVGTLERQKGKLVNQVAELNNTQKETGQTLKACETEKEKLSQEIQKLTERENSLIQENRKLAVRAGMVERDLALFREKAETAAKDIQLARKETAAELNTAHTAERKKLLGDQAQLQSELSLLTKQLEKKGKVPFLPPEKVAELMGDLVNRLGGQMPGMKMRTGEMKLKIAFGAAGDVSGFVVPTPDIGPEVKENLHEVTIRFDRATAISGPEIAASKG